MSLLEAPIEPFDSTTITRPNNFRATLKPAGPICDLDCAYCDYFGNEVPFPADGPRPNVWRMTDGTLKAFVRQYIQAQPDAREITFRFQGGEPILLGVEFFRKVVEHQSRYARPRHRVSNTLKKNGTLLDDEWCRFLKLNDFRVTISIGVDGPDDLLDARRHDDAGRGGRATVGAAAERALRLLQEHEVDSTVLYVLNRHRARDPLDGECRVRSLGHGGCPKDRIRRSRDNEPGLNYLCAGHKQFFEHIDTPMRQMAKYLRRGVAPATITPFLS